MKRQCVREIVQQRVSRKHVRESETIEDEADELADQIRSLTFELNKLKAERAANETAPITYLTTKIWMIALFDAIIEYDMTKIMELFDIYDIRVTHMADVRAYETQIEQILSHLERCKYRYTEEDYNTIVEYINIYSDVFDDFANDYDLSYDPPQYPYHDDQIVITDIDKIYATDDDSDGDIA